MKEETKDLAYFQQQIAEKYGYENWEYFINDQPNYKVEYYCNEVAELYANHFKTEDLAAIYTAGHMAGFLQGKQEGEEQAKQKFYDMGWNHGLKWAAENIELDYWNGSCRECGSNAIDKKSILKGLKEE